MKICRHCAPSPPLRWADAAVSWLMNCNVSAISAWHILLTVQLHQEEMLAAITAKALPVVAAACTEVFFRGSNGASCVMCARILLPVGLGRWLQTGLLATPGSTAPAAATAAVPSATGQFRASMPCYGNVSCDGVAVLLQMQQLQAQANFQAKLCALPQSG